MGITWKQEYDVENRLTAVRKMSGGCAGTVLETTTFAYNGDGSPSRVEFTVSSYGLAGSPPNIGINMIMYFDTSDLIVHYSGYNMTSERFCPLTAPFDHVRLWMGQNPPDTPSFETVSLEEATSLTIDQFSQLMMGDPKKACFTVKGEVSP